MSAGAAALRGLIAAVLMAALCFLIGTRQDHMEAETQAIAYGVVFGIAMGYLVSLSGKSVLKSSAVGLFLGAGMLIASFYLSYSRRH